MPTYLITFTTYASHLTGDPTHVTRLQNTFGTRLPSPQPALSRHIQTTLKHPPFSLTAAARTTVLTSIAEVCRHKHWHLHAAHIRTNHVHVVVDADTSPERAMTTFKGYATRALGAGKHWTRHGSTHYLWTRESVDQAIHYVLAKQGERMAVYSAPLRSAH